jgi:hypothetical protein
MSLSDEDRDRLQKMIMAVTDEPNRLYNLINLTAVLYKLRPGAILAFVSTAYHRELFRILDRFNILARKYPIGDKNIIITRKDRPDLVTKLQLLDIVKSESESQFHINTGEIIGYIKPINIMSREILNAHKIAYSFNVDVRLPNNTIERINYYPQRVSEVANGVGIFNEVYAKNLLKMKLPDGFEIVDVKIITKALTGGRRSKKRTQKRRTKRARSRRRS